MRVLILLIGLLVGGCYYPDDGDPSPAPGSVVYTVALCPDAGGCPGPHKEPAPYWLLQGWEGYGDPAGGAVVYYFDAGDAPDVLTVWLPPTDASPTSCTADACFYAPVAYTDNGVKVVADAPVSYVGGGPSWGSGGYMEIDLAHVPAIQACPPGDTCPIHYVATDRILSATVMFDWPKPTVIPADGLTASAPPGWYEGHPTSFVAHTWPLGCGMVWPCPVDHTAKILSFGGAWSGADLNTYVIGTSHGPVAPFEVAIVAGGLRVYGDYSVVAGVGNEEGMLAMVEQWETLYRPALEQVLGDWPVPVNLQIWDGSGAVTMEHSIGFTFDGSKAPNYGATLHEGIHGWWGTTAAAVDPACDLLLPEGPTTWLASAWGWWVWPSSGLTPQASYDARIVKIAQALRDKDAQGLVLYPAIVSGADCSAVHVDTMHWYGGQTPYFCGALWLDAIGRAAGEDPDWTAQIVGDAYARLAGAAWPASALPAVVADVVGGAGADVEALADGWLHADPHAPGGCLERADELLQTLRVQGAR